MTEVPAAAPPALALAPVSAGSASTGTVGLRSAGTVPTEPRPPAPPVESPRWSFEPAIAAAIGRIDRAGMQRDLAAIVGDRNDRTAGPHLRAVTRHVEAQLRRAGWTVRRETIRHGDRIADNLIADRAGRDADRVVVVAAHLDTVPLSPGADDDGSGLAALLSIARAASRLPTSASLRILAFAFEEDGLIGSSQYVAALPESERSQIVAVLSMDMIGYRDPTPWSQRYPAGIEQVVRRPLPNTGDFVAALGIESEPILAAMEHAQQYVTDLRAGVVPLRRWQVFAAPDVLRGDHAPFWLAGIPAAAIGDTGNFRNPHYHQQSDRLESIDLDFATLAARWVGASALTLAGVR